jgi:hypothetical protein
MHLKLSGDFLIFRQGAGAASTAYSRTSDRKVGRCGEVDMGLLYGRGGAIVKPGGLIQHCRIEIAY